MRHQLQHLTLALRQLGRLGVTVVVGRASRHATGDARRKIASPAATRPDRPHDLVPSSPLEQVATGAGAHGREQDLVVLEHRDHHDRALGDACKSTCGSPRCRRGPASGYPSDEIRRERRRLRRRPRPGRQPRPPGHAVMACSTWHARPPVHFMVVGDEHAPRSRSLMRGPAATSCAPALRHRRTSSTVSAPPSSLARSRIEAMPTPAPSVAGPAAAVVGDLELQRRR